MTQLVYMTNPRNATIQFDSRQSVKNAGWSVILKWLVAVIIFGHIFPPRVQAVPLSRDANEQNEFEDVPGMKLKLRFEIKH